MAVALRFNQAIAKPPLPIITFAQAFPRQPYSKPIITFDIVAQAFPRRPYTKPIITFDIVTQAFSSTTLLETAVGTCAKMRENAGVTNYAVYASRLTVCNMGKYREHI